MRKTAFSVAALALAISAGSALAADLPHYKAPPPPPPPPPPMWTGFYVGLNAGYTFANSNNTTLTSFPIAVGAGAGAAAAMASSAAAGSAIIPSNRDGFIGGGQVGYNWQFASAFVAGFEADIQGVAGSNNAASVTNLVPVAGFPANPALAINTASSRLDYLGTVRGRLGWLFTPTLLVYGTGGLAYGGVTTNASTFQSFLNAGLAPFAGASAFADTRVGWTAGGGLEWMFWPNWSAKVEYLYYDLGNVTQSAPYFGVNAGGGVFFTNAFTSTTRFDGHIVRAGLNYHFNWGAPAPVVAKY